MASLGTHRNRQRQFSTFGVIAGLGITAACVILTLPNRARHQESSSRAHIPNTAYEPIRWWDAHDGPVTALICTSDGKSLLSGGVDGEIALWDILAERITARELGDGSAISSLCYSEATRQYVAGTLGGANLFFSSNLERLPLRIIHEDEELRAVRLTPDGNVLITTSTLRSGNKSVGMVKLFNAYSGTHWTGFPAHEGNIDAVTVDRESKYIFTGGADGVVKRWPLSAGESPTTLQELGHPISGMALNGKGGILAVAVAQEVHGLDASTGTLKFYLDLDGQVNDLSFSSNGKYLAVAATQVGVFRAKDGEPVSAFGPANIIPQMLCFSVDGQYVFAGTTRGCIYVWRFPDEGEVTSHGQGTLAKH